MEKYIGRLLDDRYEILEIIGAGGMSTVYKARCNRLNRLVAIKILKDDLLQDAEFRRRFHAESQAVAMLSHPNIVGVYDVSHGEKMDYIVMELIEGISLKQYLEQKRILNWREALHFATQIAKALEHAHSRGIIHRDIKPHNIMILKDGSVKVADFGIAQISTMQDTLTREALGSVHYISPEQAKGAHVDERSDLYSLGVVMYEMLTGRPPFDGDTPVSVAIQHINATAAMPHTINAAIPMGLEQMTMHAMQAPLDKRYESAGQLLADLEEFRKNPNLTFDFTKPRGEFDMAHLIQQVVHRSDRVVVSAVPKAQPKPSAPKEAKSEKSEPPKPQKGARVAVIAGVICIALALVGIGYFLYSYFFSDLFATTDEDVVPNFIGQYYEDIDAAQYPNFTIHIKEWVTNDNYEMGYVVDQNPVGNRPAKVGATIELTLSSGADSIKMPNLINSSLESALALLHAMDIDLTIQQQAQASDVYSANYIISTEPSYGEPLADGQEVVLHVSTGTDAQLVPMPTLVGLELEEAKRQIEMAGLKTGNCLPVDSDLPENTVTFQSVEPDDLVKAGTVINLQVSKGPVEAETPYITAQSDDKIVYVGDPVFLEVQASVEDQGVLTYAWYMSTSGSMDDATVVSPAAKDNTYYAVSTAEAGTYYFYCRIVNTLGDSTSVSYSNMMCVIVEASVSLNQKDIYVKMPTDFGRYRISVYVDGQEQIPGFDVMMDDIPGDTIQLTVYGSGVQMVYIYLDGQEYDSQLIDFDTVG